MAGRTTFFAAGTVTVVVILLAAAEAAASSGNILCDQTAYPSLCTPLVGRKANPRRAVHAVIRELEKQTQKALENAARYKEGNEAISVCYVTFKDALYNLKMARRSIRNHDTLSINVYLGAVVSDYGGCVDAHIESNQVNSVQNAADTLRKTGSNCLTLSTFIR